MERRAELLAAVKKAEGRLAYEDGIRSHIVRTFNTCDMRRVPPRTAEIMREQAGVIEGCADALRAAREALAEYDQGA